MGKRKVVFGEPMVLMLGAGAIRLAKLVAGEDLPTPATWLR
jgi:hypothetical protein